MQDTGNGHLDGGDSEEADLSFIRTEDVICLSCTGGDSMRRGYLAAKGFGSQLCHLVPEPQNQEACELWRCMFQLEDAMSVHAMYTHGMSKEKRCGSRKILMYGHAVLLRHVPAKRLLSCLTTSPSNDKMAYDIGFTRRGEGSLSESEWFTVHPSSSQRSEGEKVRAGDDIFLVSVSNERYLSAETSFFHSTDIDPFAKKLPLVHASFQQCVWSLHIVSSGSAKEAAVGYVNGGDVLRLVHRYKNKACLTVGARDCDLNAKRPVPSRADVCYEALGDKSHLRSLWRVELFQMRFGGGFTSWGQPFRLKHLVTGKYLAVKARSTEVCGGVRSEGAERLSCEGGGVGVNKTSGKGECKQRWSVCLVDPLEAERDLTAFCFSKTTFQPSSLHKVWSRPTVDSMGIPKVCFGDSEVYLTHITTRRVVGFSVSERRPGSASGGGQGGAVLGSELSRMFAFTVTRASEEEEGAATIVERAHGIMRHFTHKVLMSSSCLKKHHLEEQELAEVLTQLLYYFKTPCKAELTHEAYQREVAVLRQRQGLFKKQGALQYTLSVIVVMAKARADSKVTSLLYQLLAAMIRGNHENCREFATQEWLKVFMDQLSCASQSHHVLDVVQCLITDSPEVLHIISQRDIGCIVKLLHSNGRDAKVMRLLSSLCVCRGVAMRDKQRHIFKHLVACKDLLLHTSLKDRVHSVHPTVYVGSRDNSALYTKWYYEVQLTQLLPEATINESHFRVGWAHPHYFQPHPSSSGCGTTEGGVGDDVFSIGFDGRSYWVGGHSLAPPTTRRLVRQSCSEQEKTTTASFSVGDVIGCCLDLEGGVAWYTVNGIRVGGKVVFGHCTDLITPAISFSAGISAVMSLGGIHGPLSYAPPTTYTPLLDAIDPTMDVRLIPFRCLGVSNDLIVTGPMILADYEAFVPAPIVTSGVSLPDPLLRSGLKDTLAENIHEVWAKNKIEAGYTYAEVRSDKLKHNASLKAFSDLTERDRQYDYDMVLATLLTLIALGYQISTQDDSDKELPYMELPPDKYRMSNGYIPRPLNLADVSVPKCLSGLVEKLAENAHNVWAVGRISEGWTFGAATDKDCKRNSLLIPYSKLDQVSRKSNEDTALESIRTIIALGCVIAPPTDNTSDIRQLTREFSDSHARTRTFRGQTCYTLLSGKWYYEVKLLTGGMMRVGWATPTFSAERSLGVDKHSYGFDGFLGCKWHNGSVSFGQRWKAGDVVGCLLDIDQRTMSFTLNGEFLHDFHSESTIAFSNISSTGGGFIPAITLSAGEKAQFNFGRSQDAMQHDYTAAGFQPLCAPTALPYNLPLWYSSHGGYELIDHTHPSLTSESRAVENGEAAHSIISVRQTDWDFSTPPKQECLRLCVGVAFSQTTPTGENTCERLCYSAVVPAGQDPDHVFVGWTTTEFRYIESQFKTDSNSTSLSADMQYGQRIDLIGRSDVSHYSTAFMVSLSGLLDSQEPLQVLPYAVTVVCVLDLATTKLQFSVLCPQGSDLHTNERSIFLPHSTKLFPTIVTTPTTSHVIDFDFNPRLDSSPLSWHLFSSFLEAAGLGTDSTTLPICPPRFKVQSYMESRWVRQMVYKSRYSVGVASSSGQLRLSSDSERSFSVILRLPQEEETIDILEISEYHSLMDFHIQTLQTYCAVCSHSNLQLAEKISKSLESASMLGYMSVAEESMRYNLMFAYLKLFFALHLKHEVQTKLAMRGEFVIPLSECTQSVSLFPVGSPQNRKQVFSLSHAPLPGIGVGVANQLCHNVSSSFSRLTYGQGEGLNGRGLNLEELKNHVFHNLEVLLSTRSYRVKLLPATLSEIFVPLINALDYLLVIGGIEGEKDVQRLLELLDPRLFSSSSKHVDIIRQGLLSDDVACEEPIKTALCDLLHHLCDCQVQHRVESVVTFSHGFVDQLQEEQKTRHSKYFRTKPREFRCPPEMQLHSMLSRKPPPGLAKLHSTLDAFHRQLQDHCGGSQVKGQSHESLSTSQKLAQVVELINSPDEPGGSHGDKGNKGSHVTSLRELITMTMVQWAESEIQDSDLIGQIFSLLHRQFDEMGEVSAALKKTYVIDLEGERVREDLGEFIHALGSLRLLLGVGMGKSEEGLMKESLSTIQASQLFYCHPHLLRQLGVHTTVLGLIRSHLGISGGPDKHPRRSAHRRKWRTPHDAPPPVEDCCRFLCTFARISQENQRVLFGHLGYLLQHMEKYPDLMLSSGCTPLDVATATIRDNQELALALEESQLENVVTLLVAITTSDRHGSQELPYSAPGSELGIVHSASFSVNYEWNPRVGGKCLEFLQCAVWVDNEQIQENAYSVVRLLIRHSECMGPALAGEALGLYTVYKEAIDNLEPEPTGFADASNNALGGLGESFSSSTSSLFSRQSTIFNVNSLSTKAVLSYYTNLIRLLASCAPHMTTGHTPSSGYAHNKRKEGGDLRTQNILRNLVKIEDIVDILSLPYASETQPGVSPAHKTAVVWFLDRVYDIKDPEVLLGLLSKAFLPDIKLALRAASTDGGNPQFSLSLNRYISSSVLPLLSGCAILFKTLLSHLHVINGFLECCIQLYTSVHLSAAQLDNISTFLIAFSRELHPRALQGYIPKIIPNLNCLDITSTVHCKLFTAHYTRYARYYQSGALNKSYLGHADQDEKTAAALVVHRLMDTLADTLPGDSSILRIAVGCLKAATCALSPNTLVPLTQQLLTVYPSSGHTYQPRPLDTTSITMTTTHRQLAGSYASYLHDCWVYERVCEGWSYGEEEDHIHLKHNHLRPFNTLSNEVRTRETEGVEAVIKGLILIGYSLSKQFTLDPHTLPYKTKKLCIRRPKKSMVGVVNKWVESPYEPDVWDLTRVDLRIDQRVIAEKLAEDIHNRWALDLQQTIPSECHAHSSFVPYVLLDEGRKEELRCYVLDMLKFLRASGYESNRTYRNNMSSPTKPCCAQDKFGVQLFDKFLCLLSISAHSFHTQVLFPTLTAFLSHHASYFMPTIGGHRGHSFASKTEKLKILKMYCRVMEYTRQHLPTLLCPITTPPNILERAPQEGGVVTSDSDANWTTVNCILALVTSLVKALDLTGVLDGGEGLEVECPEVVDFFRQAVSGMHLTTKNLTRPDKLDSQFHFYCLHLLIPALGSLFGHIGRHGNGGLLITGPVQTHCRYIFQNLVEMAVGTGPVYVGSSPLITIGRCMGSFALAYPDPFLENGTFGFSLNSLLEQLHRATVEGVTSGNVLFVVDIINPVLTNYLCRWWDTSQSDTTENSVTIATVDEVVGAILLMLASHFGLGRVSWFPRLLDGALLLAGKCSLELLTCHLVDVVTELRETAISLWGEEQYASASWSLGAAEEEGVVDHTHAITQEFKVFTRDLATILSFLAVYLHTHSFALRSHTSTPHTAHPLSHDTRDAVKNLFVSLADIFHCWSSSQIFKREFQTSTFTLTEHSKQFHLCRQFVQPVGEKAHLSHSKKPPNLLLACLELLLPLNDQELSPDDRLIVGKVKEKLGKKKVVAEDVKEEIIQELEERATKSQPLARQLVKKFSQKLLLTSPESSVEERALNILSIAKVRYKLEQVERGHLAQSRWRQLFSQRKRKAIVKCFLAVPYFKVNKHRAINMFLGQYCSSWLTTSEHDSHLRLTEELLDRQDYNALQRSLVDTSHDEGTGTDNRVDPFSQLFTMFKRAASANEGVMTSLYTAYAELLSKSVTGHEKEELEGDDNATKAYELYSQQKAELVHKQQQLAERGAQSMLLVVLTASHGEATSLVHSTLKLGIALLKEGNKRVQEEMLAELRGMDVGFLSSVASLISTCGVLNWNAYQRFNKSEAASPTTCVSKVLPRSSFTVSLFRFLQLLCEGHNLSFQNYLRTQAGNTTTINIVICTVDYLLRLQESISDFYWHYSDYPIIDLQGRENFLKAFKVAKQVVRTLTEYVQGPCLRNQEALARSRLWDAVSGFLHIFSVLQRKLYRETSQVELLRELLGLQEEVFILMLSLLEGCTMSSNIGRMMLDTLLESEAHIQDIAQFFLIFVKLKDATTSKAFREYDLNQDGFISYREFERAMEAQQRYNKEEIVYLMECADLNKDGLLDYLEFTERFHQPAKSIGFHLCVLVVHLGDLLPLDPRLASFKQISQLKQLMMHFERNMGCIEILGKSRRVERVYFEVADSRRKQWKETQIQESRVAFLHTLELSSQKNKLKGFVSFCEDTIFEMDQADKISGSEQQALESRASVHRRTHNTMTRSSAFLSRVKARVNAFQQNHFHIVRLVITIWSILLWVWLVVKTTAGKSRDLCISCYRVVHRRLRPHPVHPTIAVSTPSTKERHRPAKLTLSAKVKDQNTTHRASTTLQDHPPALKVVVGSRRTTSPSVANGDKLTGKSKYKRVLSHDFHRGSRTPHLHSPHTLTLSYDRSRMKRPSVGMDTPTSDNLHRDVLDSYIPRITVAPRSWPSKLARNYYSLNSCKFVLTFIINIFLLSFKVSSVDPSYAIPHAVFENGSTYELQDSFWGPLILQSLGLMHFAVSAILIASYWYLKVPLIIFKREKEIARRLELKQMWVVEEATSLRDQWDRLVVTSQSFPRNYFDKQVKRRVVESQGPGKVKERSSRLGMLSKSKFEQRSKFERVLEMCYSLVDVKYNLWALGVTVSDVMIQYQLFYCFLSFAGLKWSYFIFSYHLLDLVMSFKLLRTVLNSVLNNYKQLAMTILMTCVVIYMYTVIAFNFFRKFYRQTSPLEQACDSMFKCFIYHIDVGLRSGGGIADVLEPALGDPNEFTRLLFDITFFFVVIVILLAIIQGLIIDSFGELRDREETLNQEMATKCFICGQANSKFDRVPHGFENHINKQHNMVHYLFFLLYLIKKKESEFSGQESYVWEMYLKQDWDFFPVGDCFKTQRDTRTATPTSAGGVETGGNPSAIPGPPEVPRRTLTAPT